MDSITLKDRFVGCILGLAIGDAVGAPFEGITQDITYHSFGPAIDIVRKPPVDGLFYSDDTQMMIGVGEVLATQGEIDQGQLITTFAANFQNDRGYGRGTADILTAFNNNGDWQSVRDSLFEGGSYGNGGAMRVAPVGLMFHHQPEQLLEHAEASCLPTHTHRLAIEAAQMIAAGVGFLLRTESFNKQAFFDTLLAGVNEEEYQWQISVARQLTIDDNLGLLGNGLEAHRSVMTAITCFAVDPSSYEQVIARAIGMGNDTDTLAAMAGALAGAHLGVQSIPEHLIEMLENEDKGRDHIIDLANRLYARFEGGKA